jgi:hypothetical protein
MLRVSSYMWLDRFRAKAHMLRVSSCMWLGGLAPSLCERPFRFPVRFAAYISFGVFLVIENKDICFRDKYL